MHAILEMACTAASDVKPHIDLRVCDLDNAKASFVVFFFLPCWLGYPVIKELTRATAKRERERIARNGRRAQVLDSHRNLEMVVSQQRRTS